MVNCPTFIVTWLLKINLHKPIPQFKGSLSQKFAISWPLPQVDPQENYEKEHSSRKNNSLMGKKGAIQAN